VPSATKHHLQKYNKENEKQGYKVAFSVRPFTARNSRRPPLCAVHGRRPHVDGRKVPCMACYDRQRPLPAVHGRNDYAT